MPKIILPPEFDVLFNGSNQENNKELLEKFNKFREDNEICSYTNLYIALNHVLHTGKIEKLDELKYLERDLCLALNSKVFANTDDRSKFTRPFLHEAILRENKVAVILALEAKINVNIRDNLNKTALMLTAEDGQLEFTQLLVTANADLNAVDANGFTALGLAVQAGKAKVVEYLAEKTYQPSEEKTTSVAVYTPNADNTALYFAAAHGQLDGVKFQLANQAHPTKTMIGKENAGLSAISIAVLNGHSEIVSVLLAASKDIRTLINTPIVEGSFTGWNLFCMASAAGHTAIVNTFLESKADVNFVIKPERQSGHTPFSIACHNGHAAIARAIFIKLNKNNFKITEGRYAGLNYVQLAAILDDPLAVEVIFENIMDLALRIATINAPVGSIKEANSFAHKYIGMTPLFLAAMKGNVAVATKLIECKADINVAMKSGINTDLTAPYMAFHNGNYLIIDLFVKHGLQITSLSILEVVIKLKDASAALNFLHYLVIRSADKSIDSATRIEYLKYLNKSLAITTFAASDVCEDTLSQAVETNSITVVKVILKNRIFSQTKIISLAIMAANKGFQVLNELLNSKIETSTAVVQVTPKPKEKASIADTEKEDRKKAKLQLRQQKDAEDKKKAIERKKSESLHSLLKEVSELMRRGSEFGTALQAEKNYAFKVNLDKLNELSKKPDVDHDKLIADAVKLKDEINSHIANLHQAKKNIDKNERDKMDKCKAIDDSFIEIGNIIQSIDEFINILRNEKYKEYRTKEQKGLIAEYAIDKGCFRIRLQALKCDRCSTDFSVDLLFARAMQLKTDVCAFNLELKLFKNEFIRLVEEEKRNEFKLATPAEKVVARPTYTRPIQKRAITPEESEDSSTPSSTGSSPFPPEDNMSTSSSTGSSNCTTPTEFSNRPPSTLNPYAPKYCPKASSNAMSRISFWGATIGSAPIVNIPEPKENFVDDDNLTKRIHGFHHAFAALEVGFKK